MRQRIIDQLPEVLYRLQFVFDPMLLWVFAILLTLALSIKYARKEGLDRRLIYWAGVWGILGALLGGHIITALIRYEDMIENPSLIFRFTEEGRGIFGAIIGAAFWGGLYLRSRKVPLLAYADTVAPAICLGYAIARIGCFLNGCCFGIHSDVFWAVRFPRNTLAYYDHWLKGWLGSSDVLSLSVHPTQLYHAIVGFMLFFVLHRFQPKWMGGRLALGLAGYGFLRFFLQFVRGDRTPILGILDINQIVSIVFVLIAGFLWWRFGRKQPVSSRAMTSWLSGNALRSQR
jgi:phosphatidylglycerol:prolipoprotein diacylglycerol transferase